MIKPVQISGEPDRVQWTLEKKGQFTTRSMYKMLVHRGVIYYSMRQIWKCKLPLKVKIFIWLILQGRLQTAVNLKGKKWKGSHKCVICGEPETEEHIFFNCILAKFTWTSIKEALGWDRVPIGMADFLENWGGGNKNLSLTIFCLGVVLWGLWSIRNKYAIEGVFPSQPSNILFKINMWLQKWWILLKEEDRATLETMTKEAREWMEEFLKKCKNRQEDFSFM